MNLVLVESPAKAKTINKYLGKGYEVLASFGHVRDLPAKSGSVDPDAQFPHALGDRSQGAEAAQRHRPRRQGRRQAHSGDRPRPRGRGDFLARAGSAEGKEGAQRPDGRARRVQRHHQAGGDRGDGASARHRPGLVDAYLARRALDYLVGFTLSPVLWRKLPGARSAGRVQSVALRLVCDRELEIEKFVRQEYWSLVATLATPRQETFEARLVGADGKKLQRLDIGSGAEAEAFKQALETAAFTVASVEAKPVKRQPLPAVHHLDAAAGGKPQARLRAGPHHAGGAAALRRRRHRRRDRRPHHLYAYRRRADRRRSDRRGAQRDRGGLRRATTCRPRRAATRPRPRTPRKPTRRSARPTCRAGRATPKASSMPIRPSSTS